MVISEGKDFISGGNYFKINSVIGPFVWTGQDCCITFFFLFLLYRSHAEKYLLKVSSLNNLHMFQTYTGNVTHTSLYIYGKSLIFVQVVELDFFFYRKELRKICFCFLPFRVDRRLSILGQRHGRNAADRSRQQV